jgi:hypothetical protein
MAYGPVRAPLGEGPAWAGGAPLGGVAPPMGAMTVRPAGDPVVRRRRVGGLLALVGGGAVIAGTFADWVRADLRGVGIVIGTGWENIRGNVGDGPVIALLALVVVAVGAAMVVALTPRVVRAVGVVAALAALGMAVYEIVDIATAPASLDASLRVGPWVMVGGAVVGLVGLLVAPPGPRTSPAAGSPPAPPPAPPLVPPSGPPLLQ